MTVANPKVKCYLSHGKSFPEDKFQSSLIVSSLKNKILRASQVGIVMYKIRFYTSYILDAIKSQFNGACAFNTSIYVLNLETLNSCTYQQLENYLFVSN